VTIRLAICLIQWARVSGFLDILIHMPE